MLQLTCAQKAQILSQFRGSSFTICQKVFVHEDVADLSKSLQMT